MCVACRVDQFKCASIDACFPAGLQCDGFSDCEDYSDEYNCRESIMYRVVDRGVVVNFDLRERFPNGKKAGEMEGRKGMGELAPPRTACSRAGGGCWTGSPHSAEGHGRYWSAPSYFPSFVLVKSLYCDIIFVVVKRTRCCNAEPILQLAPPTNAVIGRSPAQRRAAAT